MPVTKVLGQSYPTAATLTTLYTCANATGTVVSTINVINLGGAVDTIRIAIRPAGAAITNQHYLAYALSLSTGQIFTYTIGATLANTDVISVFSNTGTSAFSAFGQEL